MEHLLRSIKRVPRGEKRVSKGHSIGSDITSLLREVQIFPFPPFFIAIATLCRDKCRDGPIGPYLAHLKLFKIKLKIA
jgi:hypothetical protein